MIALRYFHFFIIMCLSLVLFSCGTQCRAQGGNNKNSFFNTVQKGNIQAVKNCIAKYPKSVNMKDKYGSTPLHVAAGCGHREVAELLISKGADVNAKDDIGQTPLHCVSTKEIAELLISKGADVNAKDSRGWTPLFSAIKRSNKIIGELLRERGAKK